MKNRLFSTLSTGHAVYKGARGIIVPLLHPVRWARKKIFTALLKVFIAVAMRALNEDQKASIRNRATGLRRTVRFSVPVPRSLHKNFNEDDNPLKLFHAVANDAMAVPLALIGYRIGVLDLAWNPGIGRIEAMLEVGIASSGVDPQIGANITKQAQQNAEEKMRLLSSQPAGENFS